MKQKGFRNLVELRASGSSLRSLDFFILNKRFKQKNGAGSSGFFSHKYLNNCMIIKHNLRIHERGLLPGGLEAATKIVCPYDPETLEGGGYWIFIEESGFESKLLQHLGLDRYRHSLEQDLLLIKSLSAAMTFDPFFLKLCLERDGFGQSAQILDISEADALRLKENIARELAKIISIALDETELTSERVNKLTQNFMSNNPSVSLEPLMKALRMSKMEFNEAIHSWKGFIYYRWQAGRLPGRINQFIRDIALVNVNTDNDELKKVFNKNMASAVKYVHVNSNRFIEDINKTYDLINSFCHRKEPLLLKRFLISVPEIFERNSSMINNIFHIIEYWEYIKMRVKIKSLTEEEADQIMRGIYEAVPDYELV